MKKRQTVFKIGSTIIAVLDEYPSGTFYLKVLSIEDSDVEISCPAFSDYLAARNYVCNGVPTACREFIDCITTDIPYGR